MNDTGEWVMDERPLRKDVNEACLPIYNIRVFKVISGDSGIIYWVQRIENLHVSVPIIYLCDCPVGKFKAPLSIIGVEKLPCKHTVFVESQLERTSALPQA